MSRPTQGPSGAGRIAAAVARRAAGWGTLRGWRVALAAAGAGLLGALAMPPWGLWPAFILSLALLALLVDGRTSAKGAFGVAFLHAFAFHCFGLNWIANAFLVDAERFAWMIPFVVAGLPTAIGLFIGLAAALWYWMAGRLRLDGPLRLLGFAAIWSAAEWARGHAFTGFPWNLAAHAWTDVLPVLQSTAVIGAWGLSAATAVVAALVAGAALPARHATAASARPLLAGVALVAIVWAAGIWRLAPGPVEPGEDAVRVRIVQASVAQEAKWLDEMRVVILGRHLDMTALPADRPPDVVVWPETAVPLLLLEEPHALAAIGEVLPEGAWLITGIPRRAEGVPHFALHNSVAAIDDQGRVGPVYDKAHLVPFGEYVPGRGFLPVERVVPGRGDYIAGPGPQTLSLPGLPPFSPLVCYEAIFPGKAIDGDAPPGWLVNVTNDAWFGDSAGPRQHLAVARLRAIEEGLPMVRAANTGISAVIDPFGRITDRLELGVTGLLDAPLPDPLPGRTLQAHLRDLPFLLIVLGSLSVALLTGRRPR